jgi:nicotinamidase-related amidase
VSVALLVIDMQNDFCRPSAPLFVTGAPAILSTVQAVVDGFRALGAPVVWVMRRHRPDGSDVDRSRRGLFARQPFLVESPGVDLVAGLAPLPSEPVIVKRRWSAFFGTDLDLLLRRLGIARLYLAGVQTPNCIRATACDASALDYDCVVIADATASASAAVQEANLADLREMGIEVLTARAALQQARCLHVPAPEAGSVAPVAY